MFVHPAPQGHTPKGFRWGPSPMYPTPATTQRGQSPLWNPPYIAESPMRGKNGPGGAAPRQTSGAFAEEEGGAAQRAKPAARGRMRDAELVPTRAAGEVSSIDPL